MKAPGLSMLQGKPYKMASTGKGISMYYPAVARRPEMIGVLRQECELQSCT